MNRISEYSKILIILLLFCAPAEGQNLNMGATYFELDNEVQTLRTVWPDAVVVSTRQPSPADELSVAGLSCQGDKTIFQTAVYDLNGHLTLALCIRETGLELFQPVSKRRIAVTAPWPFATPTTDWSNLQAYCLMQDLLGGKSILTAEDLEWAGSLLRPRGVISRSAPTEKNLVERLENRIQQVEATFKSVIAISTTVDESLHALPLKDTQPLWDGPQSLAAQGSDKSGRPSIATFSTVVKDRSTGKWLGGTLWFEEERIFSWNFGDWDSGYVSDEIVPGGIPFEPNVNWSNIQAYSFWRSGSTKLNQKDTPGCTGLHWLDNTIFRKCCDDHDRCYEHYGCTFHSWWFNGSWSCIRCNATAVWCFITGGAGGHDDDCEICCGDICPASCSYCRPAHNCPV